MNFKEYSQEWFEDGQIDEVAFCENFLQRMPLKCINGIENDKKGGNDYEENDI